MAVLANMREFVRRPGTITPRYGLFTVAQAMGTLVEGDPMPRHAGEGGVEYWTGVCGSSTCYEVNCIDTLGTKPVGTTSTVVTADPFVVLTSLSCGSVGLDEQIMRRLLDERAAGGEQALVEAVFSTAATCGQAPSLTSATDVGASANVVEAVSLLEAALYNSYHLPGVLHIPTEAAAFLAQAHVIWRDSAGIWRTNQGTYVSIGNYQSLGADVTFYISGQVNIWRSAQPFYTPFKDALNRSTNQVNAFREREYIVGFECEASRTNVTLVVV